MGSAGWELPFAPSCSPHPVSVSRLPCAEGASPRTFASRTVCSFQIFLEKRRHGAHPGVADTGQVPQAYKTYKLGGKMSELLYSPATYGVDLRSQDVLKPRARQAPMMAVVRNTLWLIGGIVEVRTIAHRVSHTRSGFLQGHLPPFVEVVTHVPCRSATQTCIWTTSGA